MYVYRTSQFNSKAERYGIQERINQLCSELKTQRTDEVQARFERIYPYLKRRILNRRLIARILRVDNEQLLCLLDIFKRGDNDYEKFLEEPIEYGKNYLEPQLNETQLRQWLRGQTIEQNPVQELPELPLQLHPWLEPPGWEMDMVTEDWVIYESEEWVKQFQQREIQEAWFGYYQVVAKIIEQTVLPRELAGWSNLKLYGENNHYVVYSELNGVNSEVGGILFLLAPFEHEPSEEEIRQLGETTGLFDYSQTTTILAIEGEKSYEGTWQETSQHKLTPFARRYYPAYLLADQESWLAIERGREANLALSSEEKQILQSVSASAPANGSLPLFINGRAGSGKSTMLLYLFADYCYRKYYNKQGKIRSEPLPGQPLFLTYNERLLEVARDGVNRLLSSHHRFVSERSQGDEMPSIDQNFQPFGGFLINLLPARERKRFAPSKYISFHRFKQLYQGKNSSDYLKKNILQLQQKRRYSPEVCWHVIRTFIKGYGLENYMTPEDYQEEVPRKEQTIDLEKFQGIYDTIWERWYKHLTTEQGYWDDQDLIARVIQLQCYSSDYTAIFCDEAQDFTRLELKLIMRLSIFSQYRLGYQPIHSLPFAFAGDPFQTLNPTGFRWSSVQAAFESEVIKALDPADQLKLGINFQELRLNYRSSPPIVQVTNLIQLWRHVLFNLPELQPQTPWQKGHFPETQKFILNQNITTEELASHIKDTIIIVPCEEGEEVTYAQADEVLSVIVSQQSSAVENLPENSPPKNILSAISAKGLEFKKVILYKFGEECNQSIWNQTNKAPEQKVKVEYFFNKLYVAASRATERLFVVDSEQGNRQLWQYASDEALLQAMQQFARNQEIWQENVRTISPGIAKNAQELEEDDPGEIALELETKGLNSRNPSLLRRASQFYSGIGDLVKAGLCQAWALKFEELYREAGERFLELGELDQAWNCFWQGICWSELVLWYNQHAALNQVSQTSQKVGQSLAIFMVAPPDNLEAIENFTKFLQEAVIKDGEESYLLTKQSEQAIEEYIKRIEMLLKVSEPVVQKWQEFGQVLIALDAQNLELYTSGEYTGIKHLAAECFYHAKNYDQAVSYWEDCGTLESQEYYRAKALVQGYPEGLEFLEKAGEQKKIIAEWKQAGRPRNRQWLKYVAPALETQHYYQQAFVVYIWLDKLVKVKECFEKLSKAEINAKLFTLLWQYCYRHRYCFEAIEAAEQYLPKVFVTEWKKAKLKFDFIYQLACSDLKPDDFTKKSRQRYEKFVREQIISNSDWSNYLLMPQVGIALEKIGSLRETLGFYEKFVSSADEKIRQFARERWLATKIKQVDYALSQGQNNRAAKSRSELLKKADNWAINPQLISPDSPIAPREQPTPLTKDSLSVTAEPQLVSPKERIVSQQSTIQKRPKGTKKPVIKGLPPETKIERLENGLFRFALHHLIIKVMGSTKQVLITDLLNSQQVRLDGVQCQINIGEAVVEAGSGRQLSFVLPTSNYKGQLICEGGNSQLELEVKGLSSKIYLEF
ncbi:MAG: hypothetical protein WA919_05060 [Coleofasciculaceae cyanobacterium]